MQQLILTMIALLGLFTPTANNRIAKFFVRFVPPMSSGRVACDVAADASTGTLSGQPQGKPNDGHMAPQRTMIMEAVLHLMAEGDHQPEWSRPDPLQRRIRRAQRAAGCRYGAHHHESAPAL